MLSPVTGGAGVYESWAPDADAIDDRIVDCRTRSEGRRLSPGNPVKAG
jgi:hypothetical protein